MKLVFKCGSDRRDAFHFFGIIGIVAIAIAGIFPFERVKIQLCMFRAVTGIPCPSCGMTTCFVHMVHGRIMKAFYTSPLGMIVFLFTAVAVLQVLAAEILHWPAIRIQLVKWEKVTLGILIALAVLLNWFYNISHVVFHWI